MATAKKTAKPVAVKAAAAPKGPKLVRDEAPAAAPDIDKAVIRAPDPVEDLPGFVRGRASGQKSRARQAGAAAAYDGRELGTLWRARAARPAHRHGGAASRIDRVPPPALVDEIRGARELPEAAQLGLYATERAAYALGIEGDSKEQLAKIQAQIDLLERRHRTI